MDSLKFQAVCNDLGLPYTSDWGIINADKARIVEFIDYVTQRESLDFSIKYNFLELIIASMNDAIVEGEVDYKLHAKFHEYVKPVLKDDRYYPHIPYWISIKSKDEFPIGFLLEQYLRDATEGIESS